MHRIFSLKRPAAMLLAALLCMYPLTPCFAGAPSELPAQAQQEATTPAPDTTPPEILFLKDASYMGLPVIHVRDKGVVSTQSEFYGFEVKDDGTAVFADMTFTERQKAPEEGIVTIAYNAIALQGFCAPAAGVVTLYATDAAGNTTKARAWCEVVDEEPPYYLEDNRLSLQQDALCPIGYLHFQNERLCETGSLAAVHIVSLPSAGTFYLPLEENRPLTGDDLPYTLDFAANPDIPLTYATDVLHWYGEDSFEVLLTDTRGNTSSAPAAILLNVTPVNLPPAISGLPQAALAGVAGGEALHIPFQVTDRETPPESLKLSLQMTPASFPADGVMLRHLEADSWEITLDPAQAAHGTYTCLIQAVDKEGLTASADVAVSLARSIPPTRAEDDSITNATGASVLLDVLQNDTTDAGAPLSIAEVSAPLYGKVEIVDEKLLYTFDTHGHRTDAFTYTLKAPAQPHPQDVLRATVCINDTTPPQILDVQVQTGEGWQTGAFVSFRVEDALGVASVHVEAAGGQILTPQSEQASLYTLLIPSSGAYRIHATDKSGNKAEADFSVQRVDSTAPTIELQDPGAIVNGYCNTCTLLVTDEGGSGINEVLLTDARQRTPEGAHIVATQGGGYTVTLSSVEETALFVSASDKAGNQTTFPLGILSADDAPPVIEIPFLQQSGASETYLPLPVTVADAKSGVMQITIDSKPPDETGDAPLTLPIRFNTPSTCTITASDRLGNRAEASVYMLAIPSPDAITPDTPVAPLLETIENIRLELEAAALPEETSAALYATLDALTLEASLIDCLKNEDVAAFPAFEARIAEVEGVALSPSLLQAFEEAVRAAQTKAMEHAIDALPVSLPQAEINAWATLTETTLLSYLSYNGELPIDALRLTKLYGLYEEFLAYYGIRNRSEDIALIGLIGGLDIPGGLKRDLEVALFALSREQTNENGVYTDAFALQVLQQAKDTAPTPLRLLPGKQVRLVMPLPAKADALSLTRSADTMQTQAIDTAVYTREEASTLLCPLNGFGSVNLSYTLQEEAPAPENAPPSPSPSPSPTPSPTPSPSPTPIPRPIHATPDESLHAQDASATPGASSQPANNMLPLGLVALGTLLVAIWWFSLMYRRAKEHDDAQ